MTYEMKEKIDVNVNKDNQEIILGWFVPALITYMNDILYEYSNEFWLQFKYNRKEEKIVKNTKVDMYVTEDKSTYEECKNNHAKSICWDMKAEGELVGRSAWTITWLNLEKLEIWGHNLKKIIMSYSGNDITFNPNYINIKFTFNN